MVYDFVQERSGHHSEWAGKICSSLLWLLDTNGENSRVVKYELVLKSGAKLTGEQWVPLNVRGDENISRYIANIALGDGFTVNTLYDQAELDD